MKRISFMILAACVCVSMAIVGCEHTKGATKRVTDDLKKTEKRVEKAISDSTKDFRERNQ